MTFFYYESIFLVAKMIALHESITHIYCSDNFLFTAVSDEECVRCCHNEPNCQAALMNLNESTCTLYIANDSKPSSNGLVYFVSTTERNEVRLS